MPFTSAFGSSVRECSLSVHEYHWSIGGRTGRHTSFGTRGSQVQILPLRPIFLQCDQAPLKRVVAVSSATGTVIGTETISHIRAGRCAHSSASGLANGRAGLLTSQLLANAASAASLQKDCTEKTATPSSQGKVCNPRGEENIL